MEFNEGSLCMPATGAMAISGGHQTIRLMRPVQLQPGTIYLIRSSDGEFQLVRLPEGSTPVQSSINVIPQNVADESLAKTVQFFTTVLSILKARSVEDYETAKNLIQQLVNAMIDPETFTLRLQEDLKCPTTLPMLTPFLKDSIFDFRSALISGNTIIDGICPPPYKMKRVVGMHWGSVTASNVHPEISTPFDPQSGQQSTEHDVTDASELTVWAHIQSHSVAGDEISVPESDSSAQSEIAWKSIPSAQNLEVAADDQLLDTVGHFFGLSSKRSADCPSTSAEVGAPDSKRSKTSNTCVVGPTNPDTDSEHDFEEALSCLAELFAPEPEIALPAITPAEEGGSNPISSASVCSAVASSDNRDLETGNLKNLDQIHCMVSYGRHIFTVDLVGDQTIGDLKEQCYELTGLPISQMGIVSDKMATPAALSDEIVVRSLNLLLGSKFILFVTNHPRWIGNNETCRVMVVNGFSGEQRVIYINQAQTIQEFKSHVARLMHISVNRQKWYGNLEDAEDEQLLGQISDMGFEDSECVLILTTALPSVDA